MLMITFKSKFQIQFLIFLITNKKKQVPNSTYLIAASRYLRDRLSIDLFEPVGYIILSDSQDLACQIAQSLTNIVGSNYIKCLNGSYGSPQPLFDWILLTLTDHIIASSGTFAVWASHHINGYTVAYSDFFLDTKLIDASDFYKPGTLVLHPEDLQKWST